MLFLILIEMGEEDGLFGIGRKREATIIFDTSICVLELVDFTKR